MVVCKALKKLNVMTGDGHLRLAVAALAMLALSACGGGGSDAPLVPPGPKAVLKIASIGTPSAPIAGIGVTVVLPAGVTPPLNPDGSAHSSTIYDVGGVNGGVALAPMYTPATSTAKGTLRLVMASTLPDGIGAGEFATVILNTSSAAVPSRADFAVTGLEPIGLTGSPVTGLTPEFTLTLQ